MTTISELEEQIKTTRLKLEQLEKSLVIMRGNTVLLSNDERFSALREDLTVTVIAEGIITIGNPHILLFIYDNKYPSNVRTAQPTKTSTIQDLSDDEQDDIPEVNTDTLPVTSDFIGYSFDIPKQAVNGQKYAFFVTAGGNTIKSPSIPKFRHSSAK